MLTRLDYLLDKALRGIDLTELPIIVVVITPIIDFAGAIVSALSSAKGRIMWTRLQKDGGLLRGIR